MEGVATTRDVFASLVAATGFCLACSATHVARDTPFGQFSVVL